MQETGLVGLGRMGANMARRLSRAGLKLAVYDRTHEVAQTLAAGTWGPQEANRLFDTEDQEWRNSL